MCEHNVQCSKCMKFFRPVLSQINLVCKECYEERPPDATGLIKEFLEDLKEFELKRYSDIMRTLEGLRKKWEAKLKE